ncbi:unnamed protein product [Adineta steineri]|uniref:EF-hand domain-containing protein n=1 Tax=Adineta steineri TaxID=433720 RepID=A0A814KZ31_9BILA|nr:unnamed protein product [Adineta steineri]
MADKKAKKAAQRASSNVYSMFEQKQVQEFKEAFGLMDQDRDGSISLDDLKEVYSSLGKAPKESDLKQMLEETGGPVNRLNSFSISESPPRIISSNKDPSTDQQMSRVNAIVAQPGRHVWRFEHLWSHPLYSCCTDLKQCCYAFFCPWCYECNLFDRAGENLWTCICPGARYALRSKIRTAFRIEDKTKDI